MAVCQKIAHGLANKLSNSADLYWTFPLLKSSLVLGCTAYSSISVITVRGILVV